MQKETRLLCQEHLINDGPLTEFGVRNEKNKFTQC